MIPCPVQLWLFVLKTLNERTPGVAVAGAVFVVGVAETDISPQAALLVRRDISGSLVVRTVETRVAGVELEAVHAVILCQMAASRPEPLDIDRVRRIENSGEAVPPPDNSDLPVRISDKSALIAEVSELERVPG